MINATVYTITNYKRHRVNTYALIDPKPNTDPYDMIIKRMYAITGWKPSELKHIKIQLYGDNNQYRNKEHLIRYKNRVHKISRCYGLTPLTPLH
jgi:hypothetical protein